MRLDVKTEHSVPLNRAERRGRYGEVKNSRFGDRLVFLGSQAVKLRQDCLFLGPGGIVRTVGPID